MKQKKQRKEKRAEFQLSQKERRGKVYKLLSFYLFPCCYFTSLFTLFA